MKPTELSVKSQERFCDDDVRGKEKGMVKLIASLIFIILLIGAGSAIAGDPAGPRIDVKEFRHDGGNIVQGTRAGHVFEIRNTGTRTLVIERLQPS